MHVTRDIYSHMLRASFERCFLAYINSHMLHHNSNAAVRDSLSTMCGSKIYLRMPIAKIYRDSMNRDSINLGSKLYLRSWFNESWMQDISPYANRLGASTRERYMLWYCNREMHIPCIQGSLPHHRLTRNMCKRDASLHKTQEQCTSSWLTEYYTRNASLDTSPHTCCITKAMPWFVTH